METYKNSFIYNLSQLGYKDYYILIYTGTIYNTKSKRALRSKDNQYNLYLSNGKRKHTTLAELYRQAFNREYQSMDNTISFNGEVWQVMDKHNINWQISNYGRIKKYEKYNYTITNGSASERGYLSIQIHNKKYLIHRLVAEYFLDNPKNKPIVHHKDCCHINNCADNLEYLTYAEHLLAHLKIKEYLNIWRRFI